MANAERERFEKAYGRRQWFKAEEHLPPRRTTTLTIADAYYQDFPNFNDRTKMVEKLVLEFEGDFPPLIVPGPVATICADMWGWDVKKWRGNRLPLRPTRTDVRGKVYIVARVDLDALDHQDERDVRHSGEELYARGNGKDGGGVEDLPDNDLDPNWKK